MGRGTGKSVHFGLGDDPQWYKDAVIYELHVRAFYDSDGDGIGDFPGLTAKLDYLQDLGITALWLLPFYPSPLKDDGYDIADYTDVHPAYGTAAQFKLLLKEAHRRGLRVITELVLNHTSDQHPWFQRARQSKAAIPWRDFYVWSATPEKYGDARIIFKDFEASNWAWDPLAKAYYWHRFYAHQPDLNYDNPRVRRAILQMVDFWFGLGVDGLRLDAVPYLYEREGTTCENLPETHAFLRDLRRHVDAKFKDRMLLAEANQWPEDAVAYLGDGQECHMAFHFPLMPRLFMAIRTENRFPIIDILEQTPAIPEICQWAIFLRNHDELTLEMVTDEERDYMYRVYADDPRARVNLGIRRRLAPLLGNGRRRIELMNGLLFSLPGTPVVYYGDEIGMGDNIYLGDRNGVRTPMQWSADRNAGFSRANSQKLYLPVIIDPEYHYEAVNVEAHQNNPNSLLWWMKRLIALRKRFKAFSRGALEFLHPENRKVLAYIRRTPDEHILVVANLSRFVQHADLSLPEYQGRVPVELFGRTEFPPIGELPYMLTLGPHAFYWFALEPARAAAAVAGRRAEAPRPSLVVSGDWQGIFENEGKKAFEHVLPRYLQTQRWFGGKARTIQAVQLTEAIPFSRSAYLTLMNVEYVEGEPETYALGLTYATGERGEQIERELPHAVVTHLLAKRNGGRGVVYDALWEKGFCQALLQTIERRRRLKGWHGEVRATPTRALKTHTGLRANAFNLEPSLLKAEQSNTSVIYGKQFILKLFRRLEPGINPDWEIGRFLTARAFAHIPAVKGAIEYRRSRDERFSMAILQDFVANEGDAWQYTLDTLSRYFERVATQAGGTLPEGLSLPPEHPLQLATKDLPPFTYEMIGIYLQAAELLGRRTAEMHVALASESADPDFAPEAFTALYQRALYQSLRSLAREVLQLLRKRLRDLPDAVRADAQRVLDRETEIHRRFHAILERKIQAMRTRCHGDYHLGQVLYTGKDFVIIDFEGEPARALSQRRLKRSPLMDVAGMLRSFHYAAHAALFNQVARGVVQPHAEALAPLELGARFWHFWVSVAFLKTYLSIANQAQFLPRSQDELRVILDTRLLEKAVYELGYELNNRPEWLKIPLQGILQLLEHR